MAWKGLHASLLAPGNLTPSSTYRPTLTAPQDPPEGLYMPSLEPLHTIGLAVVILKGIFDTWYN